MYGCLINKPAGIKPLFSELEIPISPPTRTESLTFVNRFSLVGGLIGISLVLKTKGGINIPSRDSTDPMNEITENGIYTIIPANDTYGTLIVFQSFGGAGGIVQFYAHPFGNGIYRFRIKTSNNKNEWSEWKNF